MDEKNIKLIRLINNTDLIAEVQEAPNNKLYLIKPMVLHMEMDIKAQKHIIYMYEWLPGGISDSEKFLCLESNIIFICDIKDDLISTYKNYLAEVEEEERMIREEMEEGSKDTVVSFFRKNLDKNTTKH
jgi:hypothetical protein